MKYIIALILALATSAYAFDPLKDKVQVLDVWQCGQYACAVAIGEDGKVLLILADKRGAKTVVHKGNIIYERDGV